MNSPNTTVALRAANAIVVDRSADPKFHSLSAKEFFAKEFLRSVVERRTTMFSLLLLAVQLVFAPMNVARAEENMLNLDAATHKPMLSIKPMLDGKPLRFHTFTLSPDHRLWLCCTAADSVQGAVLVYDVAGQFQQSIAVPFVPTAIDFSAVGDQVTAVFVAGSGKIAKLDPAGKILASIDAPNLGNREEALEALRQEAKAQIGDILAGVEKQAERVNKQIAQLEITPEGETEAQEARRQRRLKLLRQQIKQIELTVDSVKSGEAVINESSLSRLEYATGLAVSEKYVFVSLPTVPGHGYDVWRLDHNLSQPKKILQRGMGCCGQFDIQSDGTHLVVAENVNFRVAFYDDEGQPIKHFGKRSATEADGFGSCCNPMNVCCQGDQVLTAESSIGHIKRFSSDGELLAYIGTAPIGGGCKHVALEHDPQSDKYFMFNEDRKCISVLVPKSQATSESDDERAARIAMEGLGKQLLGSWQLSENQQPSSSSNADLVGLLTKRYGSLLFGTGGELSGPGFGQVIKPEGEGLAAFAKLMGSDEAAQLWLQSVKKPTWNPIEQADQTLTIGFADDGVSGFQGKVQFVDQNSMTIAFLYGTVLVEELKYQRTDNK